MLRIAEIGRKRLLLRKEDTVDAARNEMHGSNVRMIQTHENNNITLHEWRPRAGARHTVAGTQD